MRQGTIVTVPPVGHPLSLEQAKRQLRLEPEDTEEDDHIADLCAAAHRKIERELGFPILRQTLETHLRGFPRGPIWLGGGADVEIVAVRYQDAAGAAQVVEPANYRLNAVGRIAEVYCGTSFTWPSTARGPGSVVIEWTGGWATPGDVPEDLVHAMKLLVGHWDMNREAVVVGTISSAVQETLSAILEQFHVPFVA